LKNLHNHNINKKVFLSQDVLKPRFFLRHINEKTTEGVANQRMPEGMNIKE